MRAQSHVVGVALMLGVTVLALGGLTVGIGTVLDAQAASADANRVATDLDAALAFRGVHGPDSGRVRFSEGRLATVERDLRVLRNGSVVAHRTVGGVVFETGDRRVAAVAGAVVRGRGKGATLRTPLPVTGSERTGVLVVGAPRLGADDVAVSGAGGVTVRLSTNVSHDRSDLGRGRFAVAVETATPAPFRRRFRAANATTRTRDFDGDGLPSLVARYPGRRQGYLVVHDLRLEVARG